MELGFCMSPTPKKDGPKWKWVTDDTYRLEVPGGWLYRYSTYHGPAMVFVPYCGETSEN